MYTQPVSDTGETQIYVSDPHPSPVLLSQTRFLRSSLCDDDDDGDDDDNNDGIDCGADGVDNDNHGDDGDNDNDYVIMRKAMMMMVLMVVMMMTKMVVVNLTWIWTQGWLMALWKRGIFQAAS